MTPVPPPIPPEDDPVKMNAPLTCFMDSDVGAATGNDSITKLPVQFPIVIITTEVGGNLLSNSFQLIDAYKMACGLIHGMYRLGNPWAHGIVAAHNAIIATMQAKSALEGAAREAANESAAPEGDIVPPDTEEEKDNDIEFDTGAEDDNT